MAIGDLITLDHQYEYMGVLIGSGTRFLTESWDGLFGIPNLRSNDLNNNAAHGVIPGQDLMGGRAITGKIHILNTSGASATFDDVEALQTAFRVKQNEYPFVYKLPGRNKRYINCRPRKADMPKDANLTLGHGVLNVQLFSSKPKHYELAAVTTTGLTLVGTSISQSLAVNIPSNWFTDGVFTIVGPCSNPMISVSGQTPLDGVDHNGRTFGLTMSMNNTDILVIDMFNKTVKLNGNPVYTLERTDAQWFSLLPGNNNLTFTRFNGNNGSTSSCTLVYNSAWMY